MKKLLLTLILAILVLPLANATQITTSPITLKPCETAQILLHVQNSATEQATLHANIPVNYIAAKYPTNPQLQNGQTTIPVIIQIKCDAGISQPGNYPINFQLQTTQTTTRATTTITIQDENALDAQLTYNDEISCNCGAANFNLLLTNYGNNAQRGTIIASNPQGFKTAISENQYEIPAHTALNRTIGVAIPCDAKPDAYAINVVIAKEYDTQQPITQLQSAFITQACYASTTTGKTYIEICQDQPTAEYYTLSNTGTKTQTYTLQTTFGTIYPGNAITLNSGDNADFALVFTQQDVNESLQGQFALTIATNTTIEQKPIQVKIATCQQNTPITPTIPNEQTNQTNETNSTITGLFTALEKQPGGLTPIVIAILLIILVGIAYKYNTNQQKQIYTEEQLTQELQRIANNYPNN